VGPDGHGVREDHGVNAAIILEDPAYDADVNSDDVLWLMARHLASSFISGRSTDDKNRDITVAEIQRRSDNRTNQGTTRRNAGHPITATQATSVTYRTRRTWPHCR